MVGFFPRESIHWGNLEEPPFLRRLSFAPWPLAIVAGIGVRLSHAALFGTDAGSWLVGSLYAVILVLFACGALTAHVGNFTLKHWLWRVPLFALAEATVESLVSLALIALGVEPFGADRATMGQWPAIAVTIIRNRLILLSGFGLVLAGAVEAARFALYKPTERAAMDVEADEEAALATGEHDPPVTPAA